MSTVQTRCCIVGGGPAGMMLGFLLARAGIDVVVLEKHADFLRDFRGDTIHPSTLELMHELGLVDEFLKLPHQKAHVLKAAIGGRQFNFADFSHLPVRCPYIAFMPQWDFLDFLARHGQRYPGFGLRMKTEATDLIEQAGAIVGVRARQGDQAIDIRAALVVGCDGRHSVVCDRAKLALQEFGAPIDVLWFHLRRQPSDPEESMGVFAAGRIFVLINRGDYWQCGFVIPKGTIEEVRRKGLAEFHADVARTEPLFAGRTGELDSWDKINLLTVQVSRLTRWWRHGLLCIGDAAHAMSPVGGIGINLAVQDAVAAANILTEPLRAGAAGDEVLERVQRRREFPTRVIQRAQVLIQNQVITGVLGSQQDFAPPWPVRLLDAVPILRRLPARFLGLGVRPEHIRTPERVAAVGAAV